MTDMHGQNGRRLLALPLAAHSHEAQPSFLAASYPVATNEQGYLDVFW
ncbi:hypothetical protein HBB89_003541 [Salmonella enterica]|nr:hypothetical protein [Salmonella enterica]EIF6338327.1 hypothetical protein [Salmonella enterica]EII7894100.1 hypothetical protein [Salmonella enterica]EIX3826802.1 hypothetical protein [Salmonella enterica]EJD9830944.1 hypothetical protein [Salmonella enterica]